MIGFNRLIQISIILILLSYFYQILWQKFSKISNEIDNQLKKSIKSLDLLQAKCQSIEQQLLLITNDKQQQQNQSNINDDLNKIQKMFLIKEMIKEAQNEKIEPYIWFASNQTNIPIIIMVAKHILEQSKNFPSCQQQSEEITSEKFDPYRNCFRSISIEFHNRLTLLFDHRYHWFTLVGRIQYTFMITTIQSKRNEYLFQIGKIYFQIIQYDYLITSSMSLIESDESSNNHIDTESINQTQIDQ